MTLGVMRINGRIAVTTETDTTIAGLKAAFARARAKKPAYSEFYPFLEALCILQIQAGSSLELLPVELSSEAVQAKWEGGFPLLQRWEFPLDAKAATTILAHIEPHLPASNRELHKGHAALQQALARHPEHTAALWQSFLQHDWEPWDEWVPTEGLDLSALLYLARSCLRRSLERVAADLFGRFPLPDSWLKGYCPFCGSLPSLLLLQGDGERKAHCSWCGTQWGLGFDCNAPTVITAIMNLSGTFLPRAKSTIALIIVASANTTSNKSTSGNGWIFRACLWKNGRPCIWIFWHSRPDGVQPPSPSPIVYGEGTP